MYFILLKSFILFWRQASLILSWKIRGKTWFSVLCGTEKTYLQGCKNNTFWSSDRNSSQKKSYVTSSCRIMSLSRTGRKAGDFHFLISCQQSHFLFEKNQEKLFWIVFICTFASSNVRSPGGFAGGWQTYYKRRWVNVLSAAPWISQIHLCIRTVRQCSMFMEVYIVMAMKYTSFL